MELHEKAMFIWIKDRQQRHLVFYYLPLRFDEKSYRFRGNSFSQRTEGILPINAEIS